MVREGKPTKPLSRLVSPTAHPPYIIVLSKSNRPACIQLPGTPLSMDRWLIIAPAVVQAPFIASQVQSYSSMSQYRWLPYYRSHHSHHINAVGGLILSYCLCKRCKRNAVVQRTFFCCERGSNSEQRRLLRLDVTFIRFRPLQSY